MNLRNTTLLTIGITTLALIGVLLITVRAVMLPYFEQEQQQSIERNLQQVRRVIDEEVSDLELVAGGLGRTGMPSELKPQDMENLAVQLVAWLPADGTPAGWYMPEGTTVLQPLPAELAAILQGMDGANSGLAYLDGTHLWLVGAVKVLYEDGSSGGAMLAGRVLDEAQLRRISTQVQLPVQLERFTSPQTLPPDYQVAYLDLSEGAAYTIRPLDSHVSAGYLLLEDVQGDSAAILQIQQARSVYRTGVRLMNFIIIALAMSGLTFSTILFLVLEMKVLSRLRRLNQEMTRIGQSGDIARRVGVEQSDELTELARTINAMLSDLQQAQTLRQVSEERFRSLVESMDDVVFTIDRSQGWLEVLSHPARQTGSTGTLTREQVERALSVGQMPLVQRVMAGERLTHAWELPVEGGDRHYLASLSPIHDPAGEITGVVGVARDITTLKNLESSLRQRVEELAALFEVSQIFLNQAQSADVQQRVCLLAVERFGMKAAWLAREDADGNSLSIVATSGCPGAPDHLSLRFQAADVHPAVQAYRTGQVVLVNDFPPRAGSTHPAIIAAAAYVPLAYPDQSLGILALLSNDKNKFNEEHLPTLQAFANLASAALQNTLLFEQVMEGRQRLQDLSRQLVNVQEQERRQIAMELHDEIGQILTGLRLLLEINPASLPADSLQRITEAQGLVKELIDRVRQISLNLRPSILDDLGLLPTLYWHFNRYTTQTGIQVIFNHSGVEGRRFSGELETAAYRMVQEALTNVARYAEVNEVHVHLWCNETTLGVQVEDNGRGFHLEDAMNGNTRGISGLRERLMLLGGRLEVETQPGSGTCLTAEIPLVGLEDRKDSGGKT